LSYYIDILLFYQFQYLDEVVSMFSCIYDFIA